MTQFKKGDTVDIRVVGKVVEVFEDRYEFSPEGTAQMVQEPSVQVAIATPTGGEIRAMFTPAMMTKVVPPLPKKVGSIVRSLVSGNSYIYESSGRWVRIDQPKMWYHERDPEGWDYEVVRDGPL